VIAPTGLNSRIASEMSGGRAGLHSTSLQASDKNPQLGGMTMRRRLRAYIPIVLFAVLVQLLAPIGAFRAVASSVSDPLAMASICSGMASAPDSQDGPAHQAAGQCCAFCICEHGAGVASADAPPGFSPWRPDFQFVTWCEPSGVALAVPTGSNAQARAPPALA
jgi:hypothetical protein